MNLFKLSSTYSNFGYHRTGSDSQLVTEDWLWEILKTFADEVVKFDYSYHHFAGTSELFLDGQLIPSMPLYYEAVGEMQGCRNLEIATVDVNANEHGVYTVIQQMQKQAVQKKCEALVIATRCANNSLYAFNVSPDLKNSLPTVLVPGVEYEGLNKERITLDYSAQVSARKANNIIARFGDIETIKPVVITTPISGWFECAGERGTGVALAITLAERLSKTRPVELVLASGHELGYLGGFQYTASLDNPPAVVIHLGSCLATRDAKLEAWSNTEADVFNRLSKKFNNQKIVLNRVSKPSHRTDWVGEAECWSHFNCPMLSIAGDNPVFHTPEDRIELATDEGQLTTMLDFLCSLTIDMVTPV